MRGRPECVTQVQRSQIDRPLVFPRVFHKLCIYQRMFATAVYARDECLLHCWVDNGVGHKIVSQITRNERVMLFTVSLSPVVLNR